MKLWVAIAVLAVVLVGGVVWFAKWRRRRAEEQLKEKRRRFLEKRRALREGSRIAGRGLSLVSLEGTVVRVVDDEQVIARMRRVDEPMATIEEGPFPIRFINEIDGKWFGWD